MTTRSSRLKAIVVGGSLGGLFAANLLSRNGWEVDVFERVPEELAGRGAGIVTHPELFEALTAAGVDIDDSIGVKVTSRVTLAQDGGVISERDLPQTLTAWGKMYHVLRSAFPDAHYHSGGMVASVQNEADCASVTLNDGTNLTERVESVRGTPDNPMTRDEVVAKCRDLIGPVLGPAATARLIEKVLGLENMKSIRELRPLLQKT